MFGLFLVLGSPKCCITYNIYIYIWQKGDLPGRRQVRCIVCAPGRSGLGGCGRLIVVVVAVLVVLCSLFGDLLWQDSALAE